ncbi:MAG: hypothetical protein ISR54_02895 [Chlorobium phaeobacteroides]|uniref:Lipoprotein n=1 Tax=Chlorobium phaeobacteroides (strain BS1) TaxID=331678 RepID=B3EMN3_CHLPB|nr:hypothetical protein [Chlorobium phaeobacteroides]
MRHSFSFLAFLMVFTIALSSCSQDKEMEKQPEPALTTSEYPLIEPCALVTRSEAETLLGEPVDDAEKSEQKVVGMKLCLYNPQNEDSWGFLQVSLTQPAFMPATGLPPSEIFHSIKDAMSDSRTDLEGFGDEAFIATGGLYILKGEYYITIGAGNIDRAEIQERLKAAGKIALGNLDQ